MSRSLYLRPAPVELPPAYELSSDLMFKLADRYELCTNGDPFEVDRLDIPYLEGLRDCGVESADELIEAIREHERVLIWIEN